MAKIGAEPPDEVLVVAAILGDLDAFDELALRYRAAVVRAAQAIVGREDAEDVAQDALLLAFKALPSIEEPAKFAAWLSAITRHRAFRFSKRERPHRSGRVELDEFLIEQVQALGHPFVSEAEADDELRAALDNVPAEYAGVAAALSRRDAAQANRRVFGRAAFNSQMADSSRQAVAARTSGTLETTR